MSARGKSKKLNKAWLHDHLTDPYVKLAQRANREGQEAAEQRYLAQAQQNLRAGLSMNPGNEARELAEGLLRMFR